MFPQTVYNCEGIVGILFLQANSVSTSMKGQVNGWTCDQIPLQIVLHCNTCTAHVRLHVYYVLYISDRLS